MNLESTLFLFGILLIPAGGITYYARAKLAQMKTLAASGVEVQGRILSVKKYTAAGRADEGFQEGNIISYEFPSDGKVQKGKLRILSKRLVHPEQLRENAPALILYLRNNPRINIPKDLLADKMAPVTEYYNRTRIIFPFMCMLCVVLWMMSYIAKPQ